ncbi:uncharacterized protein Tco025E_10143 [Trypanosoma conorhini]|uniref:Uncharacterized protein n=1 Tax=Trypanosoma conorhini TaxID=83891 RepID=A0A422MPM0_9TRYP|nr:uncharacterized protein Tco025E_10143 [Trypanosoma conorhini]RNE95154.1 hypothetical protein Tco025E_10143 [Trypanosoma conorhini]
MGASPSAGRSPPSLGASAVAAVRASVVPVCLIAPPLSFLPSFSPRPLALRRRGAEFLRSATVAPRPRSVSSGVARAMAAATCGCPRDALLWGHCRRTAGDSAAALRPWRVRRPARWC